LGLALTIVASQVSQFETVYFAQNSYSAEAKLIIAVVLAPVWEESVKVGLGIVAGALVLIPGSVARKVGNPGRGLRIGLARWASALVFLTVAVYFVVSESLGGGVDGEPATLPVVALKILGHPGFSVLALSVGLEARPRALMFVGLGWGFHSLANFIVEVLPQGFARNVVYLGALAFIVCLDVLLLSRWHPQVAALIAGIRLRIAQMR